MGRAIDATGIQFKMLNRSRGPAVWSPRAQATSRRYGHGCAGRWTRSQASTWLIGAAASVLVGLPGGYAGVRLEDGRRIGCRRWSSRPARS